MDEKALQAVYHMASYGEAEIDGMVNDQLTSEFEEIVRTMDDFDAINWAYNFDMGDHDAESARATLLAEASETQMMTVVYD